MAEHLVMIKPKYKDEEEQQHVNGSDRQCSTVEMFEDFLKRWEKHEDKFESVSSSVSKLQELASMLERNTQHLVHLPDIKDNLFSLKQSNEDTQRQLVKAIVGKNKSAFWVQLATLGFFGLMIIILLLEISNKDLDVSQRSFNIHEHDYRKQ